MDSNVYDELNAKCQEIITREGMLHIASVPAGNIYYYTILYIDSSQYYMI